VAVVDRMGILQVMLRDRYAGAHTPETARRKAWTATSFRANTTDMLEITAPGQPQAGVRQVTDALMARNNRSGTTPGRRASGNRCIDARWRDGDRCGWFAGGCDWSVRCSRW
jgi:hypothetical protein